MNRFDESVTKAPRLEIGESLINNNFSVTLLSGFRRIKYIPKGYRLNLIYFKTISIANLFKISLSFAIFFWLLKNIKPTDILLVSPDSLWVGMLVKKIKKCKLHLDIRTIPVTFHNTRWKINYFLFWVVQLKLFHRYPDSFSFITTLLKEKVEKEFKTHFKDYVIWHSGVNVDHFASLTATTKISGNIFIITYIGVITRNRGIDLVLCALAKMIGSKKKKILFQVIGDGPYLPVLKGMSSELGIKDRVLFKGSVPYESIPEQLVSTDCFICPLPDRPEWNVSSPIKVFEYLSSAKPVILTPIVAHKNIINRSDFIIWTEGDRVQNFIKAIKYAVDNYQELANEAKKAPNFVRNNYEWKVQGKKLSLYLKNRHFSTKQMNTVYDN